ncbi:MAG: diacylglycerol kinase family lipid kinase [Bacteroidaceae bacterium]|nr:diacylglycerol kinase family lipid kinase [Bacteroidaceae bacterium]
MKKILFIINPKSGTDKKIFVRQSIGHYIDTEKFDYKIRYTEYPKHAEQLAREAVEQGMDAVIAVGGDGTVNEIARALIRTNTALGIVPCGSGNGLARHLQIPIDTIGAIKLINSYSVKRLDYGVMNNMPFFCTCGMGFDAFISMKFAESGKRGLLSYIENTLRETLAYNPDTYTIQIDNQEVKQKAFVIACGNASQYGNNAFITPFASMSDGLMDVTILEPFTAIEAPQLAVQLFNGTLHTNSRVKMFKAKSIKILRNINSPVHCDGDPILTDLNIDVHIEHQGINVLVNPSGLPRRVNLMQVFSDQFNEIPNHVLELQSDLVRKEKNIIQQGKNMLEKLKKSK